MRLLGQAAVGLIVWAVLFSALYGVHGIGCAGGWQTMRPGGVSLLRTALAATWLVGIAANGAVLVWSRRVSPGFARRLAVVGAAAGLAATIVGGVPILLYPGCI